MSFLPFFPLASLTSGSSILLIFSKNEFWVLLFFSIDSLCLISLIFALIYIFLFLCLHLDLICFSFFSYLGWKLRFLNITSFFFSSTCIRQYKSSSKRCLFLILQFLKSFIFTFIHRIYFNFSGGFFFDPRVM